MFNNEQTYVLPASMVVQIKQVLDQIPGSPVRGLHNAIDAELARQDEERRAAAREALKNDIRHEIAIETADARGAP
jgi:hypothetical protein